MSNIDLGVPDGMYENEVGIDDIHKEQMTDGIGQTAIVHRSIDALLKADHKKGEEAVEVDQEARTNEAPVVKNPLMDEEDLYRVIDINHPLVLKHTPYYLTKGGNKLVYELPDHPEILAKVDMIELRANLECNKVYGKPLDTELSEEEKEAHLKIERSRMRNVRKFFGSKHVLGQTTRFVKVPMKKEIMDHLFVNMAPGYPEEVSTIVTLQRRANELQLEDCYSFETGYAEDQMGKAGMRLYDTLTNVALHTEKEISLTLQDFLSVQNNGRLNRLLSKAMEDAQLHALFKEVVTNAIHFSQETGEIVDLAGRNNIIVFQENGVWDYRFIDPLYPAECVLDQSRKSISQWMNGKRLEKYELTNIKNCSQLRTGNEHASSSLWHQ